MSETKLKPCPFCGGEAEIALTEYPGGLYVVGCHTPVCFGNIYHFTMVFVDKKSAVKIWNTRKRRKKESRHGKEEKQTER